MTSYSATDLLSLHSYGFCVSRISVVQWRGKCERILTFDDQLAPGKIDEWKDLAYNRSHLSRVNGAKSMYKAPYTQFYRLQFVQHRQDRWLEGPSPQSQSLQFVQHRQDGWLEGPFPTVTVITINSAKGG